MEQKDLDYFKEVLSKQLNELLNQAGITVGGMQRIKEKAFPDPTDRAALEENRNLTLRIRDRENKLIKKINKALESIENGDFGVCETCGKKIALKRLYARPVTTKCIKCKEKEETLEQSVEK